MPPSCAAPLRIGTVALSVANLERSLAYYQKRIGLRLHRREGPVAYLGVGAQDLLRLEEWRGARKALRTTGLYHFALLLPTRLDLAVTLRHFAETETILTGMSDHAVSEAVYLSDPDGHGIEIYRDRPRAEWDFSRSSVKMTVDPLDVDGLFNELRGGNELWTGLPGGTVVGHVHLHVPDLAAAERFYGQVVGMDLVTRYGGGASFMATGGYHHHLGLNVWQGVGAPRPPADSLRLLWYAVVVQAGAWAAVGARLMAVAPDVLLTDGRFHLTDPAGNELWLVKESGD